MQVSSQATHRSPLRVATPPGARRAALSDGGAAPRSPAVPHGPSKPTRPSHGYAGEQRLSPTLGEETPMEQGELLFGDIP